MLIYVDHWNLTSPVDLSECALQMCSSRPMECAPVPICSETFLTVSHAVWVMADQVFRNYSVPGIHYASAELNYIF